MTFYQSIELALWIIAVSSTVRTIVLIWGKSGTSKR